MFGLAGVKGAIAVGLDADLVIADPDAPWTITNDDVLSRCGWTPYDGRECRRRGRAHARARHEVYADGVVAGVARRRPHGDRSAVATAAN